MNKEIVINNCYGGFCLSEEMSGSADDPRLVDVVKRLGSAANGTCADLRIKTILITSCCLREI